MDNVTIASSGDVLIAEDGGDLEIRMITADTREVAALIRLPGTEHQASEITGLTRREPHRGRGLATCLSPGLIAMAGSWGRAVLMSDDITPEHPQAEGKDPAYPDQSHQEGVHLMVNEARQRLEAEGFTDAQIMEWASAFAEDEGGGTVDGLVDYIRRQES